VQIVSKNIFCGVRKVGLLTKTNQFQQTALLFTGEMNLHNRRFQLTKSAIFAIFVVLNYSIIQNLAKGYTMATMNLNAHKREDLGNSTTKNLRKAGNIPGVFYDKNTPAIPILVKDTALHPFVYTSEVRVINLQIEGTDKPYSCILKDIQFDPVSDKPVHFDLLGISENEKITVEVPVKLIGTPAGVKEGGVVQHVLHSLEIECFPSDIPAHIDVNIEPLMIGDGVRVNEIQTKNFEILNSPDSTIVSVVPPAAEEVVAPPVVEGEEGAVAATEPTEPEVIAKGKKEEEEEEK
jgi:large subunit ribosomal protein L25